MLGAHAVGQFRPNFLATVSSTAILVGVAVTPATAQPPFTWTGYYVGLNFGAVSNNADFRQHDLGSGSYFGALGQDYWNSSEFGATAGAIAGYNWQSGNFIFGLEGDFNLLSGRDSETVSNVAVSTKMDWFGTFRARFGVTNNSPVMIFLTAGVAVADISNQAGIAGGVSPHFQSSGLRTGPVFGAGFEYRPAANMTVRLEGLFADFKNASSTVFFGGNYRSTFANNLAVVRGAVTWSW
jgi:outer membrane immunogenic protein